MPDDGTLAAREPREKRPSPSRAILTAVMRYLRRWVCAFKPEELFILSRRHALFQYTSIHPKHPLHNALSVLAVLLQESQSPLG